MAVCVAQMQALCRRVGLDTSACRPATHGPTGAGPEPLGDGENRSADLTPNSKD